MTGTLTVPLECDRVLVTAGDDAAAQRLSIDLLGGDAPTESAVLAISAGTDPGQVVDAWSAHVGECPHDMTVFAVDATVRSTTSSASSTSGPGPRAMFRQVDAPRLVDSVREYLGDQSGADRVAVYVDSLGSVFDGGSVERSLSLFDDLSAALDDYGAEGIFVEPAGARVLPALKRRFYAVVEVGADEGTATSALSADDIFDVLGTARSRHALRYLVEQGGPVGVEELFAAVARREGSVGDDVRRTYVGLVHTVLPKLDAYCLVDHDASAGTVTVTERSTAVQPYLSMVAPDDLPEEAT